ncbi:MAG: ABC transporter substrate-binding protein [Oscillospiraceae bacterium]
MKKRILALLLCLALGMSLAACGSGESGEQASPSSDASPSQSVSPSAEPTPDEPDAEPTTVRFAVLSGPTGVGAVKLMADAEAGETVGVYDVTMAADNQEIAGKLTNGDLDIACMASNLAATLYNKTDGGVQALCLSTLGVLYILERGEKGFTPTVTNLGDLRGKTIYATGQGANPEYVLNYLLRENGVDPATGVEIVWQTAEEVQAALLTGDAQYAMLPVPAATAAQIKSKQTEDREVVSVLDLTEEWNKVTSDGVLTMTTVVVRTEFAQEHPEAVEAFLQDYQASIEYVNSNVEDAAALVEQYGIVPSAAIAKLAIPDCNLVYIPGEEMRDQIQGYYRVLYEANPASIGGGLPDDAFYYINAE